MFRVKVSSGIRKNGDTLGPSAIDETAIYLAYVHPGSFSTVPHVVVRTAKDHTFWFGLFFPIDFYEA